MKVKELIETLIELAEADPSILEYDASVSTAPDRCDIITAIDYKLVVHNAHYSDGSFHYEGRSGLRDFSEDHDEFRIDSYGEKLPITKSINLS